MSPFQAESLLTEFLLAQGNFAEEAPSEPVSYTHLTLPTM